MPLPQYRSSETVADSIVRMETIMNQAMVMISGQGPSSLTELKPLRLKMAGAITACQIALNRVANDEENSSELTTATRNSIIGWEQLGHDFRMFALLNQSANPQPWVEYTITASTFMKRIHEQIALCRRSGLA